MYIYMKLALFCHSSIYFFPSANKPTFNFIKVKRRHFIKIVQFINMTNPLSSVSRETGLFYCRSLGAK